VIAVSEGIRNLSSDLVSLIAGFILILPISIFLSLSTSMTILAAVVTAVPIVLVYHFLFSATDLSVRNVLSSGGLVASSSLFYAYSTKFLGMSADYITSMVRDIECKTGIGCEMGAQMNLSYFSLDSLLLVYGGFILICYLLVQNEFSNLINLPSDLIKGKDNIFEGVIASVFGILMFLLIFLLSTMVFELSPGTQIPFLFLGGALVAGIILLNDSLPLFFKIDTYRKFSSDSIGPLTTILSIVIFIGITLNLAFIPLISQNIPEVLSILTMIVGLSWAYILSKELASPETQAKRTAALAFFVMFPFLSYLILRFIFLQVDGTNPVMLNRWGLDFDFMDKVNTFKINPWPLEAEPNWDSRWVFLKAAIINSARVTLVSIFFCTILGIIIGVTRLSNNKLASTAATVYVEVFRNLPLAVLLFLIATQIGLQFPMFIEEKSLLFGAVYYSNEGIWFATFSSYGALFLSIIGLGMLRIYLRHSDRTEPRAISVPNDLVGTLRRPFHKLGWRYEALAADIFLILSFVFLVARVSIGDSLFSWLPNFYFETLFSPVVSTPESGNVQSLTGNLRILLGPIIGLVLVIYAFLISSRVEDDGMNSMEIDDSEEGLRKRFTIWVGAFALALGFTFAGGYYKMGEILSFPEYTKDWNNDGVIDSPGSWDIVEGTGFEITPFFLAMLLGLTLFTAAVVAEIVRGSIQSLPRGQVEAAISLSLNPYQRLRLVILPQALRSMVPLLNNQFMNVWKNSSLAVVVAYTDIFYVILVMMNNVGQLIPLFLLLLVTYQAGSLTISAVMNWYNSRVTSVKI
jgi:His/Glu/Gln/Arg/opine family amino acid ABC transporter permease subunit